jgi:hypothetical protein
VEQDLVVRALTDVFGPALEKEWYAPSIGSLVHHVEQLLNGLERDGLAVQTLARLEFLWLSGLEQSERGPKALQQSLRDSPEMFVEALTLIYRGEGEEAKEITESQRLLARQANRLLDCWREVPGLVIGQTDATNGAGNDLTAKQKENVVPPDVNGDQLLAWITKARELSQVAARLKVCDGRIGNVLAFSPPDADGLWPCTSVRDVLEKIRSVELDRGIVIGVHNKRGVFGATGGDAERALSARYRAYADREQAAWPHVAAICSEIADDYARHADQEAKASELDEFA